MKKIFNHSIIALLFCMGLISLTSFGCANIAKPVSSKEAVASQTADPKNTGTKKETFADCKHGKYAKSHGKKSACASCAGGNL